MVYSKKIFKYLSFEVQRCYDKYIIIKAIQEKSVNSLIFFKTNQLYFNKKFKYKK